MKGNDQYLHQFADIANKVLDKAKKGDKIDRKVIVNAARKKLGETTMSEMDGLTVLSVLVRARGDCEVVKGPEGGTFKK